MLCERKTVNRVQLERPDAGEREKARSSEDCFYVS
jgi:hypothetical protein